ncbi:MAG: hypothetical protein WC337_08745, partial [Candidatus Muiribacteriota bacterium]
FSEHIFFKPVFKNIVTVTQNYLNLFLYEGYNDDFVKNDISYSMLFFDFYLTSYYKNKNETFLLKLRHKIFKEKTIKNKLKKLAQCINKTI